MRAHDERIAGPLREQVDRLRAALRVLVLLHDLPMDRTTSVDWADAWDRAKAALAQPATGGDEYRRGVEDAARVADGVAEYSEAAIESEEKEWRQHRRVQAESARNVAYKIRALAPGKGEKP